VEKYEPERLARSAQRQARCGAIRAQKFALEYVLRSHNSGNSQLGILALHLVKEAAEQLSASRWRDAPFGEMPQTMSFTDVLGAGAAIG
jgi:hypothetical protein